MSDQTPPGQPGGESPNPPAGGGWPPTTPAQPWPADPDPALGAASPPPPSWQGTPQPASSWQHPGTPAPGYPQPGTPAPGYPQPGTPAPGYPQPGAGTAPPGDYPQTPYPGYAPSTPYPQPAGYQQNAGYQQGGYQQGGYPPPPGQPTPAGWGGQPGQPPQKSNRNAIILISALGTVAAIVLGVVIALAVHGGHGDNKPDSALASLLTANPLPSAAGDVPSSVPAVAPTSQVSAMPGCTPITVPGGAAQPGVYDIGQTATVTGEGDSDVTTYTAQITLDGACYSNAAVVQYEDPPTYGQYVVATFTVRVTGGPGTVSVYPLNFLGQTSDGTVYKATYDDTGTRLDQDDLAAGQQVKGTVIFDVPADNHLLIWNPLFAVKQAEFRY